MGPLPAWASMKRSRVRKLRVPDWLFRIHCSRGAGCAAVHHCFVASGSIPVSPCLPGRLLRLRMFPIASISPDIKLRRLTQCACDYTGSSDKGGSQHSPTRDVVMARGGAPGVRGARPGDPAPPSSSASMLSVCVTCHSASNR